MNDETSVQALLLSQEYRLRGLGELANLAKDEPQLVWFCSVCKVNRCKKMDFKAIPQYREAIRRLPIIKCSYCKRSICSECVSECASCRTLVPGDFIPQTCPVCRHIYLVNDMCIECIFYYSNPARTQKSKREKPFIDQAKSLQLTEEYRQHWKIAHHVDPPIRQ